MKWHNLFFVVVPLLWLGYYWVFRRQEEILRTVDPASDTGPSLALNGLVVVVGPALVILSIMAIGFGMILRNKHKKGEKG
jgi:hypothetical protein